MGFDGVDYREPEILIFIVVVDVLAVCPELFPGAIEEAAILMRLLEGKGALDVILFI